MSDALVIGGGIIGLTTALELRHRGLTVTLVEKGRLGDGATGAAGGILSPLPPWRCPLDLEGLYLLSPPHYHRLFGELQAQGEDVRLAESGLLCLTSDEAAVSTLTETRYWDFQVMKGTQLKRERPALNIESDGVLFPNVCQIEPPALLAALGRMAEHRGIRIRENCEIHEIETDKKRATGVRTDDGLITADNVVLCAGAWLTSLLPQPHFPEVRPVRGQMIEYTTEPGLLYNIVWHESAETKESHYLIPRADGRILVGSTLEECGFDNATTKEARTELSDFAERVLPELAQFPIARQWAGLRPATSRTAPQIGTHPTIDGLFINGGHYRDGIALAPVSAHIAAQQICGEETEIDVRAFKVGG